MTINIYTNSHSKTRFLLAPAEKEELDQSIPVGGYTSMYETPEKLAVTIYKFKCKKSNKKTEIRSPKSFKTKSCIVEIADSAIRFE